jgi:hypothetical protein
MQPFVDIEELHCNDLSEAAFAHAGGMTKLDSMRQGNSHFGLLRLKDCDRVYVAADDRWKYEPKASVRKGETGRIG